MNLPPGVLHSTVQQQCETGSIILRKQMVIACNVECSRDRALFHVLSADRARETFTIHLHYS
jgi:hypothetical protein